MQYLIWVLKALVQHGENPFNGTVVRSDTKRKRILTKSQLTRLYLVMQQYEQQEKEKTSEGESAHSILPGSG